MVHARRTKEAFKELIDRWEGILVSDDYGTYRNWVNLHQTCLAHLLRKAQGLSEHKDPEISKIGAWAKKELLLLVKMAKAPPTKVYPVKSLPFHWGTMACLLRPL